MRKITMLRPVAALILAAVCSLVMAQNKYWVASNGNWNDPANWSTTAGGVGGAGIPRVGENVHISPTGEAHITITDVAWCKDLFVDGSQGAVTVSGAAEMNISGSWTINGMVNWLHAGDKRLIVRKGGADLDLRGIVIAGDILFDGTGSWSMLSDLSLSPNGGLVFRQGTLIGNANSLKAGALRVEGRAAKRFIGGGGVLMLEQHPAQQLLNSLVQPGNSTLVVQGQVIPWGIPVKASGMNDRDVNVCGTGPGQTPFIIDAQLISNYNGFGVSCRGVCNASVTVTVTGGIGPFTYQWLNNGPPSATWNSACGGPQIVIVTDIGQGISCPASVNVTEPGPLGVIFFGQGTPPTCADVCDGTRTALAVGGVSPHAYNWNNGAGTNSSFFQLCAGSNTLQITDANNCVFDTTFFFNIQPIVPGLSFTGASCFGECDGTAQVAPTGGTGALTITWAPEPPVGQNTTSVTGLCAGNWSVMIADANGCDTTVTFIIEEPLPIIADLGSTDVSCFGTCDGSASIAMTGAAGPFTYLWSPSPGTGQGSPSVEGLCEGTYTVLVTDQVTGCDTLLTLEIGSPDALAIQALVTPASCADECDGEVALTPLGGTPPFTYVWSPAPPIGQGTANASGLCAGEWEVLVTDGEGCDTTMVFTIDAPLPLVPGLSWADITCNGICDGAATSSVSGGTGPYSYLWTPAPATGQGTPSVSGLCAGEYELLVTDANGCDTLMTFEVIEPPLLELTATQEDVSCVGGCDGSADVEATGGVPPYTYAWTPEPPAGQGTPNATGLCPGTWEVVVTDANGCESMIVIEIEDALPFVIDLQATPASCPDLCDGAAGVVVSGGNPAFTYVWSPEPTAGQGTANANGLCPQEWSLTVIDALGCDTTITFLIEAPEPILANAIVTDATCADLCNGSIELSPSGGNGTYTYLWTPTPSAGQNTSSVSGLCAGSWEVIITSGACDTTITFLIGAPPAIEVDQVVTDVTCPDECDGSVVVDVIGGTAPFSYLWTPSPPIGQGTAGASGLCAGEYILLITDALGCDTTLTFVIDVPDQLTADIQVVQASCGGACDGAATVIIDGGTAPYVFTWGPGIINGQGTATATDLCPGAYELLVTDAVGCTETFLVLIDTPSGIEVEATITDASCASACDGSISLITSGSTAPYNYLWTPVPGMGQGTPQVTGLCPGSWLVQITDALGCDTLISFDILAPAAILPNEVWTNESCNGPCDGTASVAPTGGVAPFTFLWSPAPPSGQGGPSVTGLCAGIWTVLITDAAGCDTLVTFDILGQQQIDATVATVAPSCASSCGGEASVTASGGVGPYTYTWSPAPGAGQGTANATGLCIGGWQVVVVDAFGCDTTIGFVIEAPAPFDIDLQLIDENCNGACTGQATITVSGGVPPVQIIWGPDPIDGQGTTVATGLCSGINYTVQLVDANGCDTTITFTIEPFLEIIPNLSSTPATCSDSCDGIVTSAPTGGVAPYSYVWSPAPTTGQGTAQASGFCAGEVEVMITDAEGCSIITSITIIAPEPLLDNAVLTDVLCHAVCDGSIVVAPSGGVGPYDVYWSPVPADGQGSLIASGLCMGTYQVQIVDANGCEQLFTHEIFKPNEIELVVLTTPNDCQQCIGTAEVSISGGVPGYEVEWLDPLGNVIGTGETIENLCAGLHLVVVTDLNGCIMSQAVLIIDPNGEQLTAVHGITSCPGSCDGEVQISFTCSDPPCVVAWDDAQGNDLGATGNSVDMLCEGSYFATVTNASGCVSIQQVNVVEPSTLGTDISTVAVSCPGACDGSAAINILGGQPPFTITWDPAPPTGQGSPFASGLCAGAYAVSILDGNGCVTAIEVVVPEPSPLELEATVLDASCSGTCDGSIQPVVSGGVAPYTFVWTPSLAVAIDGSVSGLCAGEYQLTVTDASGCSISQSYEIIMPEQLQLSAASTASTCPDCDGTASVTITGGTASFSYSWLYQNTVIGTTETLTGACGGLYQLTVTDANGCIATISIIVPDNNAEVLSPVDGQVTCASDCSGSVSVDFACTDPPCSTIWTNAQGDVIGENILALDGLCIGLYYVQVTNGSGCTSVTSATVDPTQEIIPNLSITPVVCAGACDGTATVDPIGGIGPYAFVWSPAPGGGQGSPTVTGLCAGVYEVLITDASGCDTTIVVTMVEPQPFVLAATINDLSCAGDCDGSIGVNISGGVAPYDLTWSPEPATGQGTTSIGGLCAGTYSLTIIDANGCSQAVSWTLDGPGPLELNVTSSASECGDCSGGANVIVDGGVSPYLYAWSSGGNIFGTGPQINGVCAGLYAVLVMDANGCQASQVVPISDVDGPILTVEGSITSCPGTCDGTMSVDFLCLEPVCTVAWFDAMGAPYAQDATELTDACAGTYYVQVTNGLGCITIETVIVEEPEPILANLTTTPVSCAGECDGTATVAPTGGAAPYEYEWSPAPLVGQGTAEVTGLCATDHELIITDDLGCSINVPFLIEQPLFLSVSSIVSPISCNGLCDGSITIDPAGGAVPYSIVWTPEPPNGPDVFEATGLCAGTWAFTVTDGNGCVSNGSIQLLDPAHLEATLSTTDNSCAGDCDGTADVLITGGMTPYAITWVDANGQIASDVISVQDLCGGAHEVSIVDINGCALNIPFTIEEPSPLEAELVFTSESCNGPCDGSASVNVSGGSGSFTFLWQPEPGSGQGTAQVGELCADTYSVLITDASGCDTTITFTILPFTPISADAMITNPLCAGDCNGSIELLATGGVGTLSFNWLPEPPAGQGSNTASSLCAGAYTVLIGDQAGCDTTLSFSITTPEGLAVSIEQQQPASCNAAMDGVLSVSISGGTTPLELLWTGPDNFTSTEEDLDGLAPGAYSLTVTDANGCSMVFAVVVDALFPIEANAGDDLEICPGETILLDGSFSTGGDTYTWTNASGEVISQSPEVNVGPFGPGVHTFTLTVSEGICSDTDEITIIVLEGPLADAGPSQTIFVSGTATLGGSPTGPLGSTFLWAPDSVLSNATVPAPVADPSETTWFTVTVTAPNGCQSIDSVLITVFPDIVIPNGFTPNGDGWNDAWVIDLIHMFPRCEVEVYSRWGEQLFRSVGYNQPWDGRYSGGLVPVGTYYYVIKLNDPAFPDPYTGPLTVIR